ncbi:hypothetical protein GCM10029992_19920 [Glycomyces albus]
MTSSLTDLQIEVLHLFFELPESDGFVLAGGAALLAHELTERPTYDLDFFSSRGGETVSEARDAIERVAERRGWTVERIQDAPTFCRLQITGMDDRLIVDLAIDSPPTHATVSTPVGPSYDPAELAGRKMLALFDRAEARDFADVYRLAARFGREGLLNRAAEVDLGFDRGVLATMIRSLDRFGDSEIPVPEESVAELREYFRDWADELE